MAELKTLFPSGCYLQGEATPNCQLSHQMQHRILHTITPGSCQELVWQVLGLRAAEYYGWKGPGRSFSLTPCTGNYITPGRWSPSIHLKNHQGERAHGCTKQGRAALRKCFRLPRQHLLPCSFNQGRSDRTEPHY